MFDNPILLELMASEQRDKMAKEIHSADDYWLLNVQESAYVELLIKSYSIEPIVLNWEAKSMSATTKNIPYEHFPDPNMYEIYPGRSYPREIITFHVPFSGNERLLDYRPQYQPRIREEVNARIEGNQICFDVVKWADNNRLQSTYNTISNGIMAYCADTIQRVEMINAGLESDARKLVQERKRHLSDAASIFNVPFYKAESVPATFTVPVVEKKIIIRPDASDNKGAQNPTLEHSVYQQILQVIDEFGKAMERHPSIYKDKGEEALRDLFLMMLAPHFHSVTGETFNNAGKTDILIRHQMKNIFVAECKFWGGIKNFHATIDQLLSYLTWRDSKAAIVCFVRSKELTTALKHIEDQTAEHPCFTQSKGVQSKGWFNFTFHLPNEPNQTVHVAVLCFHFA